MWLPSDDTKNRKSCELPLRSETVHEFGKFLGTKHAKASVFSNMPPATDVAYMLRFDLASAGIPVETASGRLDFHSLRVTCLSWLANSGTPLRTLQEFARHSTPTLTMNVYARTLQGALTDVVTRLPDLGAINDKKQLATGTIGQHPVEASNRNAEGTGVPPRVPPNGARDAALKCANSRQVGAPSHTSPITLNPPATMAKQRTAAHQDAREWMGIEPTRDRVNDPSTALKAAGPTRRPYTPIAPAPPS